MGRYLPGHKDGGPLRTIVNLTEALGDEYQFYIACLDRDNGDTEAYPDIQRNKWNKVVKFVKDSLYLRKECTRKFQVIPGR